MQKSIGQDTNLEAAALDLEKNWIHSMRTIWQALKKRLAPAEPRSRSCGEIMSAIERNKRGYDVLWYGHYLPPPFR